MGSPASSTLPPHSLIPTHTHTHTMTRLLGVILATSLTCFGADGLVMSTPSRPGSFVRDAEIKHGRVAMTSAAVLYWLSSQGFEHPTMVLSECDLMQQLSFFSTLGVIESATYLPRIDYGFRLKEGVVPGQVLPLTSSPPPDAIKAEDFAGRIAMLSVVAFMLQDVMRATSVLG